MVEWWCVSFDFLFIFFGVEMLLFNLDFLVLGFNVVCLFLFMMVVVVVCFLLNFEVDIVRGFGM